MLIRNSLLLVSLFFLSVSMKVYAGEFAWIDKLSIEARTDLSDFKVKLATRFDLGPLKVNAVLNNVDNEADAYMVMRLGELSGHNTETVLQQYQDNKGRGWGVMAKRLGIKPGSREFHSLKRGHDLQAGDSNRKKGRSGSKGQGRGNSRGHEKKQGTGRGRGNH